MLGGMARRTPTPENRQRDAERTQRLILDASVKEFAAKGYAGARVSAIADRAGVNKQLISYYFGGKEGLYRAVADRWRERESREIPSDTDITEQIRRYVAEVIRDPDLPKLLAWEGLAYRGPDQDVAADERNARIHGNGVSLRRASEDGSLDERIDPAYLGLILLAAANAPSVYPQLVHGLLGLDAESPEFVEKYAEQLVVVVEKLLGRDQDSA